MDKRTENHLHGWVTKSRHNSFEVYCSILDYLRGLDREDEEYVLAHRSWPEIEMLANRNKD